MSTHRNVLFIAPSAYPLGGVAVWLNSLVPMLKPFGWNATVALVAGQMHDVARYRAAYPALPTVEIQNATGSHEGRIRALVRLLDERCPDVVVPVNIVDTYAAVRRVRKRGQFVKVIAALHGLAADLLADIAREREGLDGVIATNRLASFLCVQLGAMSADRALYAPCGVDVHALGNLAKTPRGGPLRIVWVGRLEQGQKRIGDVVKILSALDLLGVDYRLTLAGDGPERDAFLQSVSPWLSNAKAEYIGALPVGDMGARIYAKADVLCVTSAWETGPITAWEAMAAGVVVVSSRYVGARTEQALRNNENCLLFAVGDCRAAAAQIAMLEFDADLRDRLVLGGVSLVNSRYTLERSALAWGERLDAITRLPSLPAASQVTRPHRSGRLDGLFGTTLAETIRAAIGFKYQHTDAGGEWPHTASNAVNECEFLQRIGKLEQETAL